MQMGLIYLMLMAASSQIVLLSLNAPLQLLGQLLQPNQMSYHLPHTGITLTYNTKQPTRTHSHCTT